MTRLRVLFLPLLGRKEPVEIFYDIHETPKEIRKRIDDEQQEFLWITVDDYQDVKVQFGLPKEFCVSVEVVE